MTDVMIDLETMGTGPRAPIATIGAVFFDPTSEDSELMLVSQSVSYAVDLRSQPQRPIDPDTVIWWMGQGARARAAVTEGTLALSTALARLAYRINAEGVMRAWTHGAVFDHVVLESAYQDYGMRYPIHFRDQFCSRTVTTISGVARPELQAGVRHVALDDAVKQTIWLQRSLRELGR